MDNENVIRLCGPFSITDSLGRRWDLLGMRIFDEGYAIIDVYVDFATSMEDEPLFEDSLVIRQILARLHELGYDGPDFGPGDPGMQDERLIVLEAPEEFGPFAASKGWKNLAEQYDEQDDETALPGAAVAGRALDPVFDPDSRAVFSALMGKLGVRQP